MNTYRFPLHKKQSTVMPSALVTQFDLSDHTPLHNNCVLMFPNGTACHITINSVFSVDQNSKGLHSVLIMPNMGNAIVSDGDKWYQIAYKQTSSKS